MDWPVNIRVSSFASTSSCKSALVMAVGGPSSTSDEKLKAAHKNIDYDMISTSVA